MVSVDPRKASSSSDVTAGTLLSGTQGDGQSEARTPGTGALPGESSETTHFSIVDREGNAVAVTTTLYGNFGCKVEGDGAVFLLNKAMDDFRLKQFVPMSDKHTV